MSASAGSTSPTRATSPTRIRRCSRPASSTSARSIYNRFRSAITQIVTAQQLIPFAAAGAGQAAGATELGGAIYEYEPDEEDILAELLPRNLGDADLSARCWRTPPASRARA